MMGTLTLIQNQSTRQVRVHMKATMNSQTLMMKKRRDLTEKAVLVTLKKTRLTQLNQRLQDQTHLGRQETQSDIWADAEVSI